MLPQQEFLSCVKHHGAQWLIWDQWSCMHLIINAQSVVRNDHLSTKGYGTGVLRTELSSWTHSKLDWPRPFHNFFFLIFRWRSRFLLYCQRRRMRKRKRKFASWRRRKCDLHYRMFFRFRRINSKQCFRGRRSGSRSCRSFIPWSFDFMLRGQKYATRKQLRLKIIPFDKIFCYQTFYAKRYFSLWTG